MSKTTSRPTWSIIRNGPADEPVLISNIRSTSCGGDTPSDGPRGRASVDFKHPVDFLRGGHAFGNDLQRLPFHRCPYPVEDETGTLPACFEWVEPEPRQRRQHEVDDVAVRLATGHDIDGILFRRHVEVDVQHAFGVAHRVQEHAAGI